MDNLEIDIELVKRYVNGSLSDKEKLHIDQRIEDDARFAEVFSEHRLIIESITLHERNELKNKLKLEDAPSQYSIKKSSNNKRWWSMAASVVLIATSAYLLFFQNPNPDNLYQEYYKPYYNVLDDVQRSGESTSSPAMKSYDEGAYEKCLDELQLDLVLDPENPWLNLYKGICHLELSQTQEAISVLQSLDQHPNPQIQEVVNWYLGLAYLRAHDLSSAKFVFTTLKSDTGPYQKRASDILLELD